MIRQSLKQVIAGGDLSEGRMFKAVGEILDGKATNAQAGAFLTALRLKGETVEEITGGVRAYRERLVQVPLNSRRVNLDRDEINVEEETILQTCDDKANGTRTFNVSTTTALVVAAGGVCVARHGIRTASPYFGAAQVLENLGVNLDISLTAFQQCVETLRVGFFFGPLLKGHAARVARLRSELGMRTVFNLIAPLANPSDAPAHVLGVYEPHQTEKLAHVLAHLGAGNALVVCGEGTLDEISVCGPTRISELKAGQVHTSTIRPEDFGIPTAHMEDLRGGNARQNARIIREVLKGAPGPRRDVVVLNAAAAFVAADLDPDLESGIGRARDVIDSGKALEKLDALVRFTRACGTFVRKELPWDEVSYAATAP